MQTAMRQRLLLFLSAALAACATAPRSVHVVQFAMGTPSFPPGDAVVIDEVVGTKPKLEVGGVYIVSGRAHLSSRDEARVAVYSTGTGNERRTSGYQSVVIPRGETPFSFAFAILSDGDLNLSLSPAEDRWSNDSFGEVYFRDPTRPFLYGGEPRTEN